MIKFYEKHANLKDKFEIIAFHDGSVKTFEELDEKLEEKGTIEKRWDGKQLPFPVLLDSTAETVKKTYGISAFPTTVLINPEGELVEMAHHPDELFKTMLKELGVEETKEAAPEPPKPEKPTES